VSYKPSHNDDKSVYVGNLSFKTSEMKLGRHFEKFGDIKNVRIIEDRETEKSKGFGYVEFENIESVEKALELNG
jgi:RNA recognition motif-containing protein